MREHGTKQRYQSNGCRCDPCRNAYSDYKKAYWISRNGPPTHLFRWPLQPLFEAAGTSEFLELAYLTGFAARTVHRWAEAGLSDQSADRAAIALGLHPYTIWPEWFDPYLEGAA